MSDHAMPDTLALPSIEGVERLSWPFRRLARLLATLPHGWLDITLPDGSVLTVRGALPGPSASIRIQSPAFVRRLLIRGASGFAEAYLDGDWDSPDLVQLLLYCWANREHLAFADATPRHRLIDRLRHAFRRNSKAQARRNIAAHYDLGNEFYRLWLSPDMTYSAGLFSDESSDIEAAQQAKYARVAELAGVGPGSRVLEIGCGWGGFAEYAARLGATVTAITLSVQQRDFVIERMAKSGFSDQVEVRLEDYRDVAGSFDAIVSIEMIEAVGEAYWPVYFGQIAERLRPGGKCAIQAITIPDERFVSYRRNPDFIQRYVFPGGMLPSRGALLETTRSAGLAWLGDDGFARGYEATLRIWRERFVAAWPEIVSLGFDDRFRRLWLYYLSYCEAGFSSDAIDVRHIALERPI